MWVICGEIVAGCLTYLAYFIGTRFLDYNEMDLWCLCFVVFSVIMDYVMYVLFDKVDSSSDDYAPTVSAEEDEERKSTPYSYEAFEKERKDRNIHFDTPKQEHADYAELQR